MFNFLSSSFSCFGTAPRAPNIIGVTWYLNPGYSCCSSDTSGGQIAQVVEHQTADPWVAGSSLTSGEKCKNC